MKRTKLTAAVTKADQNQSPKPLLCDRRTSGAILGGVSVSTIRRLENAGRLRIVRLNKKSTGKALNIVSEVEALAEEAELANAAKLANRNSERVRLRRAERRA